MSANTNPASMPNTEASAPSTANATTAGAAASSSGDAVTSITTISSLSDLKNKAPQIYKFMMLSLAQNICIQMSQDQDRLTQAMKQMGDRAVGG